MSNPNHISGRLQARVQLPARRQAAAGDSQRLPAAAPIGAAQGGALEDLDQVDDLAEHCPCARSSPPARYTFNITP